MLDKIIAKLKQLAMYTGLGVIAYLALTFEKDKQKNAELEDENAKLKVDSEINTQETESHEIENKTIEVEKTATVDNTNLESAESELERLQRDRPQ